MKKRRYILTHETHGVFMGLTQDLRSAMLSCGLPSELEMYRPHSFDSEASVMTWFRSFFTEATAKDPKWRIVPVETESTDGYVWPDDLMGTPAEHFAPSLIMTQRNAEGLTIH